MTSFRRPITPYPLGAYVEADGSIRFSFVSRDENCGIVLYDKESGKRLKKIPFSRQDRVGNVYCKYLSGIEPSKITYHFFEGDNLIPDENAKVFVGKHRYGRERSVRDLKAGFVCGEFDWGKDDFLGIPYEKSVFYCMHVRGFTRHPSSGAAHKGTFLGIIEKIDYLKKTGITTLELQPAYEFNEMPDNAERRKNFSGGGAVSDEDLDRFYPKKLNYWGYKRGYYYAPKSSYAAGEDASAEFKNMVKALHAAGIEVIMQFYFPDRLSLREITDILQYWVIHYHVDGFHLMGGEIPVTELAKDPVLADTKMLYYGFDLDKIYGNTDVSNRTLGEYNDRYLYDLRKFLKGDEGMLEKAVSHLVYNPAKCGVINYFTNYYGFTLMDLVSYERKHNEANGEDNRDGDNNNCSWNCGEEGTSRRKKVRELRKKQIKNAYAMLLFGQGTPLIFMGDEFGNSQSGNNNPYCQDNEVAWLDWNRLKKNQELYDCFTSFLKIRKEHPILHASQALSMVDMLSCGYPALSYHGQNAWRAQMDSYYRNVGILFCGKYAKNERGKEDSFLYLALNMYWEERRLALPNLPKGLEWRCLADTSAGDCIKDGLRESDERNSEENENLSQSEQNPKENSFHDAVRNIPPRSVLLFIGVKRADL